MLLMFWFILRKNINKTFRCRPIWKDCSLKVVYVNWVNNVHFLFSLKYILKPTDYLQIKYDEEYELLNVGE